MVCIIHSNENREFIERFKFRDSKLFTLTKNMQTHKYSHTINGINILSQELCESRGGPLGLPVPNSP